jgi:carboxyl-terminal processing protease
MRYYTPKGSAIQARGIEPDVVVRPKDPHDVVREEGIDGHLVAEASAARGGQEVVASPPIPLEPIRVAELAADPRQGSDFVLKVGYERLLARMVKR